MKSYNEVVAPKENLELILFSSDRDEDSAEAWAVKENFPWPHILPKNHRRSGLLKYKKNFVPYYMLIDNEGGILAEGKGAVFAKVAEL